MQDNLQHQASEEPDTSLPDTHQEVYDLSLAIARLKPFQEDDRKEDYELRHVPNDW